MAKTKPGKKDLDSYNIKGTNKVVRRKLPSPSIRIYMCFTHSFYLSVSLRVFLLVFRPSPLLFFFLLPEQIWVIFLCWKLQALQSLLFFVFLIKGLWKTPNKTPKPVLTIFYERNTSPVCSLKLDNFVWKNAIANLVKDLVHPWFSEEFCISVDWIQHWLSN